MESDNAVHTSICKRGKSTYRVENGLEKYYSLKNIYTIQKLILSFKSMHINLIAKLTNIVLGL